jgi:branched-chain amino acid transport system permease protein
VILQHVVIRMFNEVQKTIPDPVGQVWVIGGVDIIAMRAIVVAITAVVVAVTYFGISRSRYGIALRASIADQDTAALMGIPVRKYVTGVFVYGSLLAGLGGALMIALFPITPFTGSVVIIRGFAVSLIGGLGNVGGAVVGGLLLGLVDGLSAGYGFPEWTDAYSLVLMIGVLIIRPQGLLGGTLGPRATWIANEFVERTFPQPRREKTNLTQRRKGAKIKRKRIAAKERKEHKKTDKKN